jgi:hypothetical protein
MESRCAVMVKGHRLRRRQAPGRVVIVTCDDVQGVSALELAAQEQEILCGWAVPGIM